MADLDLERAKKLLNSAKDLFNEGDITGVAGLAYQAFESATMALLKRKMAMIKVRIIPGRTEQNSYCRNLETR